MNEGNPICTALDPSGWLGFEQGLLLMAERPDNFAALLAGLYAGLLPRMEALAACGAHGYIGSETYCGADIISASMYRDLVHPAQELFYRGVSEIGLAPIAYFCGDILSRLSPLVGMDGLCGLMVEEPKKGARIDSLEIAERLEGALCLFGNLDSVHCLLRGSAEEVRRETLRQLGAARRRATRPARAPAARQARAGPRS